MSLVQGDGYNWPTMDASISLPESLSKDCPAIVAFNRGPLEAVLNKHLAVLHNSGKREMKVWPATRIRESENQNRNGVFLAIHSPLPDSFEEDLAEVL